MPRLSLNWISLDGCSFFWGEGATPSGKVHFPDQAAPAELSGEFVELGVPHWETAWIDLGGEG